MDEVGGRSKGRFGQAIMPSRRLSQRIASEVSEGRRKEGRRKKEYEVSIEGGERLVIRRLIKYEGKSRRKRCKMVEQEAASRRKLRLDET
jgi:hypothetical protein